jgi:hypothetical protein
MVIAEGRAQRGYLVPFSKVTGAAGTEGTRGACSSRDRVTAGTRVAAVIGVLVLVAGIAGGIVRIGLFFVPALVVLAVGGIKLTPSSRGRQLMRPDNTAPIIAAARQRHELTRSKVIQALRELDRAGTPVTFQAVAATARCPGQQAARSRLSSDPGCAREMPRGHDG